MNNEQNLTENLASLPLETFLERMAVDRPLLPAAGSAAALTGAAAAAMGGFVARIARKHSSSEKAADTFTPLIDRFDLLRWRLCGLITRDAEACTAAMKGNDETNRLRMLGPPVEIVACGIEILELCKNLLPSIHPPTRADLAVAAELAKASVDSALLITAVNMSAVPGTDRVDRMAALRTQAEALYHHLAGSVEKTF